MPGAYAHITMVSSLADQRIFEEFGIPKKTIVGLLKNEPYFELGAISPDMPYLVLGSKKDERWADAMHKEFVGKRLKAAHSFIVDCDNNIKPKLLSWFLGFVEHVVFDMTMHPIVNIIAGGEYSDNTAGDHRTCEMHQDAFITNQYYGVSNIAAGGIISSGLSNLHAPDDTNKLDPDIKALWDLMLFASNENLYIENRPDIDK